MTKAQRHILILALLVVLSNIGWAQGSRQPQFITNYNGQTSITNPDGEGVLVYDDRSTVTRNNDTYSLYVTAGAGNWTATLQWSDTSSLGPWSSFGSQGQITQASNPAIAFGFGHHSWINISISGTGSSTVVLNYSAWGHQYLPGVAGAVSFPITVPQGGTGASSLTANGFIYGNGASAVGATSAGSQYQVAQVGSSGVPTIGPLHLDQSAAVTGILPVASGGTGVSSSQGNGSKVQLSTGSPSSGNCAKFDASGNIVDAGGPCGTSSLPAGIQSQYLEIKPNTGSNNTYQWVNKLTVQASDFSFPAQTPGGTLTGGVSASVTLSPCPLGVSGSDTFHFLYIAGGTGAAEPVLITGGTCTSSAASGTVIFTPANSHSGSWTIESSTSGIGEAIAYASAAGGGQVWLNGGTTYTIYSHPVIPSGVSLIGQDWSSIIQVAANAWPSSTIAAWQTTGGYSNLSGITTTQSASGAVMRNFVLDLNGTNQSNFLLGGQGIAIVTGIDSAIEHVSIIGARFPGQAIGLLGNTGVGNRVEDSNITGYGGAGGSCAGGIFVQTPDSVIDGNVVSNTCDEQYIASSPGAIRQVWSNNLAIGNNSSWAGNMFHVENSSQITMTHNISRGFGNCFNVSPINGYVGSSSDIVISNNQCVPDGANKPSFGYLCAQDSNGDTVSGLTLSGNISDSAPNGIGIGQGCNNVIIQGNYITGSTSAGMYADNRATHVAMKNNILVGNSLNLTTQNGALPASGTIVMTPNFTDDSSSGLAMNRTVSTVSSAATITPTAEIMDITGTAAIQTINKFSSLAQTGTVIYLIQQGSFTLTTGGNIGRACTPTSLGAVVVYDGNLWWPISCQ